jgi:DNA-directed RNA polymerase subunit RPC12/RpoP
MKIPVMSRCSACGRWGKSISVDGTYQCPHCNSRMVYVEGKSGIVILKEKAVN